MPFINVKIIEGVFAMLTMVSVSFSTISRFWESSAVDLSFGFTSLHARSRRFAAISRPAAA